MDKHPYQIMPLPGIDIIFNSISNLRIKAYTEPSQLFYPDPNEACFYGTHAGGMIIFETEGLNANNATGINDDITWYAAQKNITGLTLSLTDPRVLVD